MKKVKVVGIFCAVAFLLIGMKAFALNMDHHNFVGVTIPAFNGVYHEGRALNKGEYSFQYIEGNGKHQTIAQVYGADLNGRYGYSGWAVVPNNWSGWARIGDCATGTGYGCAPGRQTIHLKSRYSQFFAYDFSGGWFVDQSDWEYYTSHS